MAKRDYFLIVDTETTQPKKATKNDEAIPAYVADFGAIVVDRKGKIYKSCAVMVAGIYREFPLFSSSNPDDDIFGRHTLDSRIAKYDQMLREGTRLLASKAAINRWLERVKGLYDPYFTAYNLAFDVEKCNNTGIDTTMFDKRFCLMKAAQDKWAHRKDFLQMVLDTHSFNAPTKHRNMSFQTKAEIMARYVLNDPDLPDEPHTALEDAQFYELPILTKLVNTTKKKVWLNPKGITWQDQQVKDFFKPK